MKSLNLIVVFLITASILSAQNNENDELKFNNETSVKEIAIDIQDGDELILTLSSSLEKGYLNISLIDPNGKREGQIQLDSRDGGRVNIHTGSKAKSEKQSGKKAMAKAKAKSKEKSTSTIEIESGTNISINSNSDDDSKTISISRDNDTDRIITNRNNTNTESQTIITSDDSGANGTMVKTIDDPVPGKWILRIETENVTGELDYTIVKG